MDGTQNKQAGFNIVELLVIVVAVGVIGAGGWFVYQHNKTKLTNAEGGNQATNQQTTATTPPGATVAYLTITEWGVKLPLSVEIKDAYYTPAIGSSKGSDGQSNTLLFGLKSLDTYGCAATNTTAIAMIFRALPTEKDGATGQLLTQEYPNGITIGNYFYAYGKTNTGTCKAPQTTVQSVDTAFLAAQKGIISATTN